MSNHPKIAALNARLESERKNGADLWKEQYTRPIFCNGYEESYKYGHEAATERLLGLLEKAVEMAEFYADKNNWKETDCRNNRYYAEYFEISEQDQSRISDGVFSGGYTAREFLTTLADASGEIKKEDK